MSIHAFGSLIFDLRRTRSRPILVSQGMNRVSLRLDTLSSPRTPRGAVRGRRHSTGGEGLTSADQLGLMLPEDQSPMTCRKMALVLARRVADTIFEERTASASLEATCAMIPGASTGEARVCRQLATLAAHGARAVRFARGERSAVRFAAGTPANGTPARRMENAYEPSSQIPSRCAIRKRLSFFADFAAKRGRLRRSIGERASCPAGVPLHIGSSAGLEARAPAEKPSVTNIANSFAMYAP